MGFYRRDLWQKFGEEFEQENGYALRVDDPEFPETWDQYYDIAAFFQNKDVGGGQKVFGHMDINVRSRASTWHFLWRYTTRLLHNSEDNMRAGDVFFEQDSMEPLINNEAGLRAMEDLLESATAKYSPPNAKALGWAEMQELWTSGQLAMGVTWPAMSKIAGDPERNKELPGGMEASGAFMLPGTKEVFDTSKNTWVTLPEIRRMPMLAWGWCFSITTTCEDPERAFDLTRYMATGDRRVQIETTQGEEYESYMDWEFSDPTIEKFYSKAPSFLKAHRANQTIGIPDLRIPGSIQMYDAVEIHKGRALEGEISAKEAVDNIAADWTSLVKERGVDTMRSAYKASVTRQSL
jgi:multiple sugar transport system substrate-binding protein